MSDLDEMLKAAGIADEAGEYVDPEVFRSGFVTLVGRPNAGKSTLLNAVMGEKVAITSRTAQTTRHRFRAVYDTDEMQMVMVDTPGLHKPEDALGEELNESALQALEDVDVVAMLIDSSKPIGRGDEWVARQVQQLKCKKILVISKTDLVKKAVIREQIAKADQMGSWDDVVTLSSKQKVGIDDFIDAVYDLLPNGPRWFPKGTGVDLSDEVLIAEFIREKILRHTRDEVPHSVGVQVEQIDRDPQTGFMKVWAVIYVERNSQKGIIIGHGGSMIKQIGSEARQDLERLFDVGVHLDLTVKVKKDWRSDASQIRKFGYGEGL
ncbi:MAG: GTPase Era [Coriobacteriales bacterium]|nr:GTPase Era [Coriobacteriaceae bacterium]MDY2722512.1 GTPase Era [Coriobacteriales bacterium]MDY5661575.1 GTPase Era [Coriobacteriales bacterium]